ncbi:MAG TPA: DUF4349 domain-containing protein, partial [Chthoniobacteraceae bacterium]|nr:DUF4349 domain-containing protein [Chthoniobacteraceae bacterium]
VSGTIISGAQAALPPIIDTRKLIRTASLDFEVPAFDKAVQTISNIATEERGYIFTQNSGKAANGKLQGEIVVKVTPANLDRFLLRVREIGEVKNETVSAQDVSKDYYDTESRMRNAQITEERMIDILKKKTGDVADLLEVEKQIADVRGEIEQMQGQLKYYDGLVQFATVTITLAEKGDVDQNAAWVLTQQAQLSLFSHDVEQAFTEAKNAASAANAQTLESHMERDVDGREVATLHLLLPPENSEDAITKMKSIGRIQTFTTQTQRVARNNAGPDTMKIEHDKVELNLVIQHDAENPVQGTNIGVLTEDVEDKANQVKAQVAAAGAEVKNADFNRAQNGAELASMLLRLPMKNYPAFIEKIKMLGTVKDFTVTRRESSNATEDAPAEIALQIYNQAAANMRNAEPVAPKITVHGTVNESSSALMWSLRMIGVSLAFLAPWAVIGVIAWWVVAMRRRAAQKS